MIELKRISKTFERKGIKNEALKNIDLTINKGDIFGVIGYSGAGKSTLVRLVNFLERPTEGEVWIEGQPLHKYSPSKLREVKKTIGMVFQHFNLLETKTVFQNVAIPLILSKENKDDIKKRVTELLEFVGLSDKMTSYPSELSGGQKQRVGIARALASNPKILLCDEATSALDPQTTQSILQLLKKINREYHITIMIITHEMSVIKEVCNRVAVMEEGSIVEQGSVLEVFGHPKHETSKKFVKTVIHNTLTDSMKKTLLEEKQNHHDSKLFKIELVGDLASKPIINELIQNYQVNVNILFANTVDIQETALVILYIRLNGEVKKVEEAVRYLEGLGIRVEEASV
ncbi:metal ABC transporter ATP-binding protein [Bacillus sp. TS-2]|nr:metal ABC transporter ATP-binding protein [Bacillus sp. TS-2]